MEVTIRDTNVYCQGKVVGKVIKAETVEDPPGIRVNMKIEDREVYESLLYGDRPWIDGLSLPQASARANREPGVA